VIGSISLLRQKNGVLNPILRVIPFATSLETGDFEPRSQIIWTENISGYVGVVPTKPAQFIPSACGLSQSAWSVEGLARHSARTTSVDFNRQCT
jgi:hypothetical protein